MFSISFDVMNTKHDNGKLRTVIQFSKGDLIYPGIYTSNDGLVLKCSHNYNGNDLYLANLPGISINEWHRVQVHLFGDQYKFAIEIYIDGDWADTMAFRLFYNLWYFRKYLDHYFSGRPKVYRNVDVYKGLSDNVQVRNLQYSSEVLNRISTTTDDTSYEEPKGITDSDGAKSRKKGGLGALPLHKAIIIKSIF